MPYYVQVGYNKADKQIGRIVDAARPPATTNAWTTIPEAFPTRAAAQQYISTDPAIGQGPPSVSSELGLTGVDAIGNFFDKLGEGSTWVRVAEFVVGGLILYVGLKASLSQTAAGNTLGSAARKTKSAASKTLLPEASFATHKVAKRVAPKSTARVAAHRQSLKTYKSGGYS